MAKKFNEFKVGKLVAEHCIGRSHFYPNEWNGCYCAIKNNYGYEDMTVEQFLPVWKKITSYILSR